LRLKPNRVLQIAMVFEPGAGNEQQNQNYDQPLFGLREDEEIEKALHRSRVGNNQ
jgi:hypothetical protein